MTTNRKNAKRGGIPTYEAEINGRTVRVTVPENETQDVLLEDAIRDAISPEAVVAIASNLAGAKTKDARVNQEVRWFCERLISMVGTEQYNAILEEIGA